jgi:hypothetical protein
MNIRHHSAFAALLVSTLALTSCGKSIPSSEPLAPYQAASADANAGSWAMIVLSGPTQIPLSAPAASSDPGYQAELASIVAAQASLTDDQKTGIAYWRPALERGDAAARSAPGPSAVAQPGRQLSCTQRRKPVRKPSVSIQQPSLWRSRLQLRRRGAI